MNGSGKSDDPIVPKKPANKGQARARPAERVEERGSAKRNPEGQSRPRTQCRTSLSQALNRIRQVAQRDHKCRFTTLWHHVYNVEHLREAFYSLKRKASAGIDGVTWRDYEKTLKRNLEDLSDRLRRGAYRAKPVKRVFIPKASGKTRPLGLPALEDKIVQKATAEVLNAIYEVDFVGFSYGFRPGRKPHDALDAVHVGIGRRKVNWVLDADIQGFFDTIDHEWLLKFVEHRVADKRVLRHIKKWLKAGVLEAGEVRETEAGTPQGGIISPLLANIYLHYAFDVWAKAWRRERASGDVIVVRYADDFVVGFQHKGEAQRFRRDLQERLARFDLALHPEKTRLIEFGRFAGSNRERRGLGKPETFDFLGFTHICGRSRKGRFQIRRKTQRGRLRRKLREIHQELRRRLHWPPSEVGRWLRVVLRGHQEYYGVPLNFPAVSTFQHKVLRIWRRMLGRRSQRGKVSWDDMKALARKWFPKIRIRHKWPSERLRV